MIASNNSELNLAVVEGVIVERSGVAIFVSPTPVAEIAAFSDRIFLTLTVPGDNGDAGFGGTNLWCIDTNGDLLWKAADLNACSLGSPDERSYCDLRIFDARAPKLDAMTSEHSRTILDIMTGQFDQSQPLFDWSNPKKALAQYRALEQQIDATAFIASQKFKQVRIGLPIVHRLEPAVCGDAPSP